VSNGHPTYRLAGAEERSDDIDGQDSLHSFRREGLNPSLRSNDTRAHDQSFNRTEFLLDCREQPNDVVFTPDVSSKGGSSSAKGAAPLDDPLRGVETFLIADRHVTATFCYEDGRGSANPATTTDNQRAAHPKSVAAKSELA
jgi:hypothetical protein